MTQYNTWQDFSLEKRKNHPSKKREIYYLTQLGKISKKEINEFTVQDAIDASKTLSYSSYSPKKLYMKWLGSEKPIAKFPHSLEIEISKYKEIITSKNATQFPPRFRQRQQTFQEITRVNIERFINYLINNIKGIEPAQIRSLKPYLKKYLIDYTKFLLSKYKTKTPQIRTRTFIGMMRYFYNENDNEMDRIESEYRNLINRQNYTFGKRGEKILYNLPKLEDIIKLLDCSRIQDKLLFNFLIRLGWRSKNIRECKLGKNIFFDGKDWIYDFPPEQQKAPMKHHDIYISIRGKIPKQMTIIIEEYLKTFPKNNNEYLFDKGRKEDGTQIQVKSDNLYSYVNYIMKQHLNIKCGPHAFRSIVAQAYTKKTGNFPIAEVWLWHKLKLSSSMYNYVLPDFDLAVRKINKFIDWVWEKNIKK